MDDSHKSGWIPVTLVTAALVTVIWALAGPALVDLATSVISWPIW